MNLYGLIGNNVPNGIDMEGKSRVRIKGFSYKVKAVLKFDCACNPADGEITEMDTASCPRGNTVTGIAHESILGRPGKDGPKEATTTQAIDDAFAKAVDFCATFVRCTNVNTGNDPDDLTISHVILEGFIN